MPFFKKFIILQFALLGPFAFASAKEDQKAAQEEVKQLAMEYRKAMNSHDKDKVKSLVTEEYFERLNKNNLLDRLFEKTKNSKKKEFDSKEKIYEVEVIESKVVEGYILVNIHKKGDDKKAHKDWYKIKKTKDGPKIEQEIHMD